MATAMLSKTVPGVLLGSTSSRRSPLAFSSGKMANQQPNIFMV